MIPLGWWGEGFYVCAASGRVDSVYVFYGERTGLVEVSRTGHMRVEAFPRSRLFKTRAEADVVAAERLAELDRERAMLVFGKR